MTTKAYRKALNRRRKVLTLVWMLARAGIVCLPVLLCACSTDTKLLCVGRLEDLDEGRGKDFGDLILEVKRSWATKSIIFSAYSPVAVFKLTDGGEDSLHFTWEEAEVPNPSGLYVGTLNRHSGALAVRTMWVTGRKDIKAISLVATCHQSTRSF
jgi:hypothetical protein